MATTIKTHSTTLNAAGRVVGTLSGITTGIAKAAYNKTVDHCQTTNYGKIVKNAGKATTYAHIRAERATLAKFEYVTDGAEEELELE